MTDASTNLQSLKVIVQKFCEDRNWDQFHSPKDLAIGVSTEAAELLELFRFKSDKEIESLFKNSEFRKEFEHELADILFFVIRLSQRNGVDLASAFDAKIKQNELKYPVELARDSNLKYSELKK